MSENLKTCYDYKAEVDSKELTSECSPGECSPSSAASVGGPVSFGTFAVVVKMPMKLVIEGGLLRTTME